MECAIPDTFSIRDSPTAVMQLVRKALCTNARTLFFFTNDIISSSVELEEGDCQSFRLRFYTPPTCETKKPREFGGDLLRSTFVVAPKLFGRGGE